MIACLIIYVLTTILGLLFSRFKQTNRVKKWYLILCAIIFVGHMALIDPHYYTSSGFSDMVSYYDTFLHCKKISFLEIFTEYDYEYGYYILNWLVGKAFGTWASLMIAVYALIYFFTFRFIYKHSKNIYLSVLLFITLGFFGFSLTGIRQTIAMSLCLWAYDFIKERKLIPFILVVLLAFSFHKTAILFLPLYFIGNFKINLISFIIVFLCCILLFAFSDSIMAYFNDVFSKSYSKETGSISYTGRIINLAIYVLTLCIIYFAYTNSKTEYNLFNQTYNTFVYAIFLGITIYMMQFFNVGIAYRLSMYFINTIMFVLVPNVVLEFKDSKTQVIIRLCYILFSTILFFIGIYRNNLYGFTYIFQ